MDAAAAGWNDFFVAVAGATAALAGLLIVAISVNVKPILASSSLPARAASAIASLTGAVAASCLSLIPGQPLWVLGIEITVITAALWVFWANLVRRTRADASSVHPALPRIGVPVLAPLVFTVASVLLLLDRSAGVYAVAAASIIAIVASVIFAWVALIEILR